MWQRTGTSAGARARRLGKWLFIIKLAGLGAFALFRSCGVSLAHLRPVVMAAGFLGVFVTNRRAPAALPARDGPRAAAPRGRVVQGLPAGWRAFPDVVLEDLPPGDVPVEGQFAHFVVVGPPGVFNLVFTDRPSGAPARAGLARGRHSWGKRAGAGPGAPTTRPAGIGGHTAGGARWRRPGRRAGREPAGADQRDAGALPVVAHRSQARVRASARGLRPARALGGSGGGAGLTPRVLVDPPYQRDDVLLGVR